MSANQENLSSSQLQHLGLVAAAINKTGLDQLVNSKLGTSERHAVSMGERVSAMIYNGLGFMDTRLYLFSHFLADKSLQSLFGRDIDPSLFNDDALGRCLDKIYAYGPTKFYSEIALEIGLKFSLMGKFVHTDTTTLSTYGEYKEKELSQDQNTPTPSYGFAKNGRNDLKQMVLCLATTGKAALPIWMEALSGNAPDKNTLIDSSKAMDSFYKQLEGENDFVFVADSAMYDACVKNAHNIKWLSRVPETRKFARQLLETDDSKIKWQELDKGYKILANQFNYEGIQQRWLLVFSSQAYEREIKTLRKKIAKTKQEKDKELWHLGNKIFSCAKDAEKAAKLYLKKLKFHDLDYEIVPITKNAKVGRPAANAEKKINGYKIQGSLSESDAKIQPLLNRKGRFILATNELDRSILSDAQILTEYKNQQNTERGFKFIKDNSFEVDSIFLKKPERIAALMAIMALCLLIFNISQYFLREALAAANLTVTNQLGKETANPTIKWVYKLFNNIMVFRHEINGKIKTKVLNLKDLHKKIIICFGDKAMEIYGLA